MREHRDASEITAARIELIYAVQARNLADAKRRYPEAWPALAERITLLCQPGGEG